MAVLGISGHMKAGNIDNAATRKICRVIDWAVFCMAALVDGADVTGTVKGPDGAPFAGAFVQARNSKTKITVSVLSRRGGQYRIPNLPAGEYEVRIRPRASRLSRVQASP